MKRNTKRLFFFSYLILFVVYTGWIYYKSSKYPSMQSQTAMEGKILYQKYNCVSCHQTYGLGGYMGPDLTNVISSEGKGRIYASSFLQSGTNKMPNFNLKPTEIESLLDYLTEIDKTGSSPNYKNKINISGYVVFEEK